MSIGRQQLFLLRAGNSVYEIVIPKWGCMPRDTGWMVIFPFRPQILIVSFYYPDNTKTLFRISTDATFDKFRFRRHELRQWWRDLPKVASICLQATTASFRKALVQHTPEVHHF